MSKSKKPTRHQQRLRRQRTRAEDEALTKQREAALADLDAPVWDEIDAYLREQMTTRPFPWVTTQDLADAIMYIGETANPAHPEARVVAVGLMDLLRAVDRSSSADLQELRASFPPEALANTNTFIAACTMTVKALDAT